MPACNLIPFGHPCFGVDQHAPGYHRSFSSGHFRSHVLKTWRRPHFALVAVDSMLCYYERAINRIYLGVRIHFQIAEQRWR